MSSSPAGQLRRTQVAQLWDTRDSVSLDSRVCAVVIFGFYLPLPYLISQFIVSSKEDNKWSEMEIREAVSDMRICDTRSIQEKMLRR